MQDANVRVFAVVTLLLSSVSLAWQVQTYRKASKLATYLGPARMTELDRKMELAQIEIIRETMPMSEGVGVPRVYDVDPTSDRVVLRVWVSQVDLPQAHDKQREKLLSTAAIAVGSVLNQFDTKAHEITDKNVEVDFLDITAFARHDQLQTFATFKNGELSFH